MAENCDKRLEFRKYERKEAIKLYGDIERKPPRAPDPQKTQSQIIDELTKKVDAQIKARNDRPEPNCGDYDFLELRLTGKKSQDRYVKLIWEEKFQLNVGKKTFEGVAKYMARGYVGIRTIFYERVCDTPFGDDESLFEVKEFDHDKASELEGYTQESIEEALEQLEKRFTKFSEIDPINPVKEEKKRGKSKKEKSKSR